ncbi:hypothetical protein DICPUDRAFT_159960 [Dictyostelium purpureum]|uniref:Uncharacterized protein n=1 Tax=Dictyostelium purpureum TaxID=5786 RepID=F1A5D5_DICPU|nr:uncharacterized protein DICPUDRAFT_159960 [Dictyostelium purpureum]EGC28594.1 hypothetical protein DICPUDRAFT_159960 [Dictyostelium purpureum]|eukprot:XP_003294883.1 hypothetical protein DICPUDRAFT_159960 [Dictyostelium purpureum]
MKLKYYKKKIFKCENNIMYKWEKYNFIYIKDYQPALWYIYTLILLKASIIVNKFLKSDWRQWQQPRRTKIMAASEMTKI